MYKKMNPNVCYRDFRHYYFDVIWTEETGMDHYHIMYRRMDKSFDNAVASKSNLSWDPSQFQLLYNYPNPFNPGTQIHFIMNTTSSINLVIYDLLGQEVARIIDNELYHPGDHFIQWDGKNK